MASTAKHSEEKIQGLLTGDVLPSYFNDGDFRAIFTHFLLEIKQNNMADF